MARLKALLERSRMGRERAAERAARRRRSAEEMRCYERRARYEQVNHRYQVIALILPSGTRVT